MGNDALHESKDHHLGAGSKGYAYCQATMYERLATEAQNSWDAATQFSQDLVPTGISDSDI
jgi:hypothetical protein